MMYVVSIAIDAHRAAEWEAWMRATHVPDVMATGCFAHATLARDEGADRDGRTAYRVVYVAASAAALARYQAEHAAALQQDHTRRYEGAFAASRETLPVVETFSNPTP